MAAQSPTSAFPGAPLAARSRQPFVAERVPVRNRNQTTVSHHRERKSPTTKFKILATAASSPWPRPR